MKKHHLLYFAMAVVAGFTSCKKEQDIKDDNNNTNGGSNSSVVTGWNGNDDPGTVPSAVHYGSGGNVPAAYDLVSKFPPIGDQGQYGTCVAWASGYNMKSALEGMDRGLNTSQLASANNQISPRDLFTAIPDASKGSNCNGTNFTDALDLLLQRGAATMQTVPYNNLNGCSSNNTQSNWTQEAAGHRIKSYRKIDLKVETIKENIANNIPVLCGAKLSDNFVSWNSDNVLSSNTTYDQVGIHAYHALIIAGYDDSKGANGAFRIINSWSQQWGDAGYVWVDYNFFVNEFCYGGNVYIAINDNGNNPPAPDPTVTGNVDLAAWAFADFSTAANTGFSNSRQIEYNIYNIGDQPASSAQQWNVYYVYYNAFDANDYGFLFYNEFTNTIPQGTYQWMNDHYALNYDIQGGDNMGNAIFQSQSITQEYYVPNITGLYYLVMIADGGDVFAENDEQNNLFYTTDQYPVYFENGYAARGNVNANSLENHHFINRLSPSKTNLKNSPYKTAVNKSNPNAYRFDEISAMITHQKHTAKWQQKLHAFKSSSKMGRK